MTKLSNKILFRFVVFWGLFSIGIVMTTYLICCPYARIRAAPPPEKLPPPRMVDEPKDLAGIYLCEGYTGDEKYQGLVGVQKVRSVYVFQFLVNSGAFTGIALAKGNQVSVSWSASAGQRGITIYTVGTDGKLAGKWSAIPGSGELNDEVLTFLRPWPAQAKEEK